MIRNCRAAPAYRAAVARIADTLAQTPTDVLQSEFSFGDVGEDVEAAFSKRHPDAHAAWVQAVWNYSNAR
jgi:hypothetical protein